eukprot:TRINITY_DN3866_c0_g3_i1.p1 TRINITY_DN3866_c0_g3~~TRINITY_DN3866_c0_g3_i1.p1  ORF type:complete len:413 (-),score=56.16 TRINITY_DN3866_c0_g3_i1:355-1593(-)
MFTKQLLYRQASVRNTSVNSSQQLKVVAQFPPRAFGRRNKKNAKQADKQQSNNQESIKAQDQITPEIESSSLQQRNNVTQQVDLQEQEQQANQQEIKSNNVEKPIAKEANNNDSDGPQQVEQQLQLQQQAKNQVQQNQQNSQPRESDVLIEFRNVHKSFGDKHILRGVNFKIYRGEAVGVIGASGTGKSTALRLIAGLLLPDDGEIYIKGKARKGLLADAPTGQAAPSEGLKVGMVFQSGALFDSLTVGENVGFLLYEHSTLPKRKIEQLVRESLECVGLKNVEHLYPSQLSGGMKKRVALARAIINDQNQAEQILMYDEPTAGLDPVASTVVENLIRSLHTTESNANGRNISSYVVVTHQHSTIMNAVDRLVFLHKGRVVWQGTIEEYQTTDEPIVRQFASGALEGPIKYR